tara:strand:- start:1654 stop:1917 length:264 start_codon:yes stop_codon:yes gene_type:complete
VNSLNKSIHEYSLEALECWLTKIGATKDIKNPGTWHLNLNSVNWIACIKFEKDNLSVIWEYDGKFSKRIFSYCMRRNDVENAILQGP